MLFSITVSYRRPAEDVQPQLDAHKEWLVRYIKAGTILVAGPLQNGDGGFILAQAAGMADIAAMIAEDPFDRHGLAAFDVQVSTPAIRAAGFPEHWAVGAAAA